MKVGLLKPGGRFHSRGRACTFAPTDGGEGELVVAAVAEERLHGRGVRVHTGRLQDTDVAEMGGKRLV